MLNRMMVNGYSIPFIKIFACQVTAYLLISNQVFSQEDSLKMIHIHNVNVSGNKQTKDYIIIRVFEIKNGDSIPYNELNKRLTKGVHQIYNTTLFIQVSIDSHYISKTDLDLNIYLKEKWYIYPLPEFKIVDRSYNEWIQKYHGSLTRVNYGVKFIDNNLMGRKDQLKISLLNGYSKDVSINYKAPYANPSLTNGFFLGAGYSQTREIAYKTSYDNELMFYKKLHFVRNNWNIQTGYSVRKEIKKSQSFSVRYTFLNVDDSVITNNYNPNYFNKSTTHAGFIDFLYTLEFIDVNNILYPLNGYTASFSLQKRGFGLKGGTNLISFQTEYNLYKSIGKNWFIGFQAEAMMKLPFEQSYINQQDLGFGNKYIRGLESFVIDGVADVITKANLKKQIINFSVPTFLKKSKSLNTIPIRIYAKLYGDAGYAYLNENFSSMLNNKFLYSAGIGIDIVTLYDLQLRIEYSFNQLGQKRLFLHNEKGF